MQRLILDAFTCVQTEKTNIVMLDQYGTIIDNTGREFRVEGFVKENSYGLGISARVLASSSRASNYNELMCRSFALAETSTDLEDEKLAILKGESKRWLICRVNLSTLGIDLVIIPRDLEIFREQDCNDPTWKKKHLRYMHFGSGAYAELLLSIKGKYLLYQRQAIKSFSNGYEASLINNDCILFDDYTKFWRLQTCYNCQGKYAKKSRQLWYKTLYGRRTMPEK